MSNEDKDIKDFLKCGNDGEYWVLGVTSKRVSGDTRTMNLGTNMDGDMAIELLQKAIDSLKQTEVERKEQRLTALADIFSFSDPKTKHLAMKLGSLMEEVVGNQTNSIGIMKELMLAYKLDIFITVLEFCGKKGIINGHFWELYSDLCGSDVEKLVNLITLSCAGIIKPELLKKDSEKGYDTNYEEMITEC
jgi:hypothetical protein